MLRIMEKNRKKVIIIISALLCGIIFAGGLFMLFTKTDNGSKSAIYEINEFESLNLRISGMRGAEEYEIISKGENSDIAYYHIKYDGEKDRRELQSSVECKTDEVIAILNDCKAGNWNGFHGKHPKGVLDGRMFRLTAKVNGGKTINADGSENFPKYFNIFENWLYKKLHEKQ